jgi:hypothetical protein
MSSWMGSTYTSSAPSGNYRSSIRSSGVDDPDYLYYNADIVNNSQIDQLNGVALLDPQVRFNETRDKPILDNCSNYHFSIIRFSMNGSNLDIPLFCPTIPLCTQYPTWAVGTVYAVGDTVLYNPSSYTSPYDSFICIQANTATTVNAPGNAAFWTRVAADGATYNPGDNSVKTVYSFTLSYQQIWNTPTTGTVEIKVVSPETFMIWFPQINNIVVGPPPQEGQITKQDLNSRFWWADDYNWVVNLMNTTLNLAWVQVYLAFVLQWETLYGVGTSPYATYAAFNNAVGNPPQLVWNSVNRTFTLYADSDCWGQRLTTFTAGVTPSTPTVRPYCRMFMNNNMYGLLSGMPTIYWNSSTIPVPITAYNIPGSPSNLTPPGWAATALTNVEGGTNEIFWTNAYYSNVADYRLAPYSGTPPLGFVPTSPLNQQKVYWTLVQDFKCTDTLWSPVQSLVFNTQLLPLVKEFQSEPTVLGAGNLGNSAPTVPSAFQPIATDFEVSLSDLGADLWRGFIQYNPTAEYRMADMAGQQPIRSIDIQVFWKSRLDGQLYPLNMFNLSSVSIKLLFRKKGADSGRG